MSTVPIYSIMRTQKNIPEQLKLSDFEDKTLLILDDDDPLRGRLARAMEKKGFQVKEAKTVAEGLVIVKNTPPGFACVDLRLEDGNGLDVVNELSKIKRVMDKVIDNAPHDVMLVLDGSTGQNAFIQAKEFTNSTEVTSLAITKLDGTAKGGVVIGISDEFKIPVKYIGVGEGIDDLQDFNKLEFVDSFFD